MSTKYNIAQNASFIIHRYIRENISYSIPNEIIKLVLLFYLDEFVFYSKQRGEDLIFLQDRIVMKTTTSIAALWSTCLFGKSINNTICDQFNVHFKWIQAQRSISIGFITSSIDSSIRDWNNRLGMWANKYYSQCIEVVQHENKLHLCQLGRKRIASYMSQEAFNANDHFTLSFDFIQDHYKVYHNGILACTFSLDNNKEIFIALSLFHKGEAVQITECVFYKNDKKWTSQNVIPVQLYNQ
eukprot:367609_1